MICFPDAKINIGLKVLNKRTDGYHNLETVFYPVPIYDILEVIEEKAALTKNPVDFQCTGTLIEGPLDSNLCVKAVDLLRKHYEFPPLRMHLHKIIPAGAGLGGGSSDGAFTIKLLNRLFRLGISSEKMREYALQLGSDCPFFIRNTPVFASGRGEIFSETQLNISEYSIAVIIPPVHVSTKDAFSGLQLQAPGQSLKELIMRPIEEWKDLIGNDFEQGIFSKFPVIGTIKEKLYALGALYASMSGSGSAVYGIFREEIRSISHAFPGCKVFSGPMNTTANTGTI